MSLIAKPTVEGESWLSKLSSDSYVWHVQAHNDTRYTIKILKYICENKIKCNNIISYTKQKYQSLNKIVFLHSL